MAPAKTIYIPSLDAFPLPTAAICLRWCIHSLFICAQPISMIATSEAFLTGLKAGLSMETIVEVVGTSSGNTWVHQNHFPNTVLKNQHEPGFMLDLMYKDIGLALALADEVGVPVPVAGLARQVYQSGRTAGLGRKDFSVVWKHMAKAAGVHRPASPSNDAE